MLATFEVLEKYLPITRTDIPSGTRVFEWIVPDAWSIHDGGGRRPRRGLPAFLAPRRLIQRTGAYTLSLEQFRERLHTLPDQPEVFPYRTLYAGRTWGSCLSHRELLALPPGDYEVVIDSTLRLSNLTVAELRLEGRERDTGEVLISTYVCHRAAIRYRDPLRLRYAIGRAADRLRDAGLLAKH